MYLRLDYASYTLQDTVRRQFPVKDKRGRTIGAAVARFSIQVIESEEPRSTPRAPIDGVGTYYGMCPHAERDGKSYGACQPDQFFKTVEERDRAVEKYFAGAAKRACKLAGR